uniref:Tyr recombinase domain-containing protein n=1 Tax=Amphimedon queenslandica TaxID=400682 RepID=A0A1X7TL86_AMPQE
VRMILSKLGYQDTWQYSGHRFKAGAATTAAALKVDDSVNRTLVVVPKTVGCVRVVCMGPGIELKLGGKRRGQ